MPSPVKLRGCCPASTGPSLWCISWAWAAVRCCCAEAAAAPAAAFTFCDTLWIWGRRKVANT
jgi:hypothetical protein